MPSVRRPLVLAALTTLGFAAMSGGAMAQYVCLLDDGTPGGATASGPNGLACGGLASANPPDPTTDTYGFATAIGEFSKADADIATAVGDHATATGLASSALGSGSKATGRLSTATGAYATASSSQSTATGYNSEASGADATATGQHAQATSLYSTATGSGSKASGYGGTATGYASEASGRTGDGGATATGMQSKAKGDYSVANGYSAAAYGDSNTSVGAFTVAGGTSTNGLQNEGNTALGSGAQAGITADGQTHSTAIGAGAYANAANATVLGAGAAANFDSSTAIGQGVTTDRAGQIKLGTDSNTYTLTGINSDDSKAAQSGLVFFVTSDANGNLATSDFDPSTVTALGDTVAGQGTQIASNTTELADHETRITDNTTRIGALDTTVAGHTTELADHETRITDNTAMLGLHTTEIASLDTRVTSNTNSIASLDGRIGTLEGMAGDLGHGLDKAYEGTAVALAMVGGGLPADKNFAMSINWGTFEGENGFAGTAAARINDNVSIHGGIGFGARQGTVGGQAGLTVAW